MSDYQRIRRNSNQINWKIDLGVLMAEVESIEEDTNDLGHMTDYGFVWGPMEVTRLASIKRGENGSATRILEVKAGKNRLTVYVSQTGRSVQVYMNDKKMKVE